MPRNSAALDPRPVARATALTAGLFVLSILLTLIAVPAGAASSELSTARDYFYDADFEYALNSLDRALAAGSLEGSDLRDAHVLSARCHARLGNESGAIDAYCSAVTVDPAWNPDPTTYSTDELALFRRALASCPLPVTPEPDPTSEYAATTAAPTAVASGGSWYKSKKMWIGAGALVLLLAVAAANGGEETGETDPPPLTDVPDFPDPPTSPAWSWQW